MDKTSSRGGAVRTGVVAGLLGSVGGMALAQPNIRAVPYPASGSYQYLSMYDLSGNGRVLVGEAGEFSFGTRDGVSWNATTGVTTKVRSGWPLLAVNSDGSVYSGTFFGGGGVGKGAFVSRSGVSANLPDLAGGAAAEVRSLTPTGSFAAGRASTLIGSNTYTMAARWNSLNQAEPLGDLPNGTKQSQALGMSDDGSVVIGTAMTALGQRAFRWTSGSGMVDLGVLPGLTISTASATTSDGDTVFGFSSTTAPGGQTNLAFKWTSGGGLQALPLLSGATGSSVSDCTADGSVAVGALYQGTLRTAALFTDNGTIAFLPYIQSLGVNLTGWDPASLLPQQISSDGTVIAGSGTYNGQTRPFVLAGLPVPTPGAGMALVMAGLAAARRRR